MIDAKQQISAVRRQYGERTLEAGEARVSTISQVYDTGQDDLWDAVTDPERITRWFLPVSGELREGGKYQFEGNAGGTISRCDKPNGFAATWEYNDGVSWVEVRLVPEGDGRTRFELEHVAQVADEFWEQFGPGATGIGWDAGLLGLAMHLADPAAPRDQAAIEAWMASDEGKLFYRLSSDGWAGAAVADGTDPTVARERADRCYAAYTGG
ncbi:SRPBCC family protein [Actinoplanes auranticolor]|uniref:Activator of HSP90 ATPase n=1 Tax=Actinoplanes auranticolor TaxID=47988 RepID=A0A919SCF1_9ACTN|nr:SRPBCC family protein [Actinoplanes auranticolor]GIM69176.1 activator of HSP90 ATPase [Actinoplanes auranticolor]